MWMIFRLELSRRTNKDPAIMGTRFLATSQHGGMKKE